MPFMTLTQEPREAPKTLRATPDFHLQPQALWLMEENLAKSPPIFEALVIIPESLAYRRNKMAECSFKATITKCLVEIHDQAEDTTLLWCAQHQTMQSCFLPAVS